MSKFKTWIEQQIEPENAHLTTEAEKKILDIWNSIFERLVGLEDKHTAVKKTLNDLTHERRPGKRSAQAILDRIGPMMQQLAKLHPDFAQRVKEVESWIGQETEGDNPDKTLQMLMERLFGKEQFMSLLNDNRPEGDKGSLQKMQPATTPPADSQGPPSPPDQIDQSDPNDPNAQGQQPQVPPAGQLMPPRPAAPNVQQPQKIPTGAFMGLY
jgi:hypothetical protein